MAFTEQSTHYATNNYYGQLMDKDIDACMCTILLLPIKTNATYIHTYTHTHVHTYISTGGILECMIYVGLASAPPITCMTTFAERNQWQI